MKSNIKTSKIEYQLPYFNNSAKLREAYQELYTNLTYDQISPMIIGALVVYVPTEVFDTLAERVLEEAKAKHGN